MQAYPELEITALLRSPPSKEFTSRYPKIQIVLGDFNAFDIIENAAFQAEIVLRKIISH